MSDKSEVELPEIQVSTELGLEETSKGALDLNDGIDDDEHPGIPLAEEDLHLGRTMSLSQELFLEVELLFGASPIFDGLDQEEIRELINVADKRPLSAGDVLFSQGEIAQALYIIQSGEVQVRASAPTGEDIVLAMLGASTVVGELALLDGGPRSATVEALSDCDIYQLKREEFDRLREAMSPAAYKVILNITRTVEARRRQTEARIAEVFEDPEQHIELFANQVHDMLARLRKA